jgi:Matrixin
LKKIVSAIFFIPVFGIHLWFLFNAITFVLVYIKRLVLPVRFKQNRMNVLLVYQSEQEKLILQRQLEFLQTQYVKINVDVLPIWKPLDSKLDFNKNRNAGRFLNLFYVEIYLIYFKYIKTLMPEFFQQMLSTHGIIICSVHEKFYSNEKITIVGFSRGFPFSHVIVSSGSGNHVLAHEIGHCCGLWHSKDKNNLMYALTPSALININEHQRLAILKARYVY